MLEYIEDEDEDEDGVMVERSSKEEESSKDDMEGYGILKSGKM